MSGFAVEHKPRLVQFSVAMSPTGKLKSILAHPRTADLPPAIESMLGRTTMEVDVAELPRTLGYPPGARAWCVYELYPDGRRVALVGGIKDSEKAAKDKGHEVKAALTKARS